MITKKTSVIVMSFIVIAVVVGLTFFFKQQQQPPAASAPAGPRSFVVIDPGDDHRGDRAEAAAVVPSPAQAAWQEREFTAFAHFGMKHLHRPRVGPGDGGSPAFQPDRFRRPPVGPGPQGRRDEDGHRHGQAP